MPHIRLKPIAQFIALVALFCVLNFESAAAGTIGITKAGNLIVRAEADPKSDALIKIEKNVKVEVLGKAGDWYKVHIKLKDGFDFTGFVPANQIRLVGTKKAPTAQGKFATSPPASQFNNPPAQDPRLDQFFKGNSPSSQPSEPAQTAASSSPPVEPRSRSTPRESSGGEDFQQRLSDRLNIAFGLNYQVFVYQLASGGTAPSDVFSYNLTGPGIEINAGYTFWKGMEDKLQTTASLGYQHGFLIFDTSLKDSSGVVFGTRKSKSALQNITARLTAEYHLRPDRNAMSLGMGTGFQYFHFKGDDVTDFTGNGIGLFVSQTTMSALVTPFIRYPFANGHNAITADVDLLPFNIVSESPSGKTGTDPKGKFGFVPRITLRYALADHHLLDVAYQARFQKYTYTGPASRVSSNNITDGSATTTVHQLGLVYTYHF